MWSPGRESLRHDLPRASPQAPARLTLILDKGNVSFDNFKALHKAQFSFLAAVPAGWVRSLFQVPLRAYQPLALAQGKRLKVYAHSDTRLGGIDGKLLVSFSPTFYRKQVRTLDLLQQKADQQLHALRASIQDAVVRKRPRTEGAVRRRCTRWSDTTGSTTSLLPTLHVDHGAVYNLQWEWDRRKKRQIKHRDLGKTVLFTDRQELSAHRMVVAYRHQAKVEDMFRIRKSRRPGLWWPAHHWTDSKLSVHALYCFLALLLSRIVLLRLQDRHLAIGVSLLTERLRGIRRPWSSMPTERRSG